MKKRGKNECYKCYLVMSFSLVTCIGKIIFRKGLTIILVTSIYYYPAMVMLLELSVNNKVLLITNNFYYLDGIA